LGVTTFLAISAMTQAFNGNLPKVSYMKAIDVWMLMCNFFVFASMIEYAFAQLLIRMKAREWAALKEESEQTGTPLKMLINRDLKLESKPTTKVNRRRHTVAQPNTPERTPLVSPWSSSRSTPGREKSELKRTASLPPKSSAPAKSRARSRKHQKPQKSFSQYELTKRILRYRLKRGILRITLDEESQLKGSKSIWVDSCSRKMFPLAFIIFNVFYWGGIMTNLALRESYEAMDTSGNPHHDELDEDFFEAE